MIDLSYPNILGYHRNSSVIYRVKEDLDRVSREAVTGQRADITAAAGGDLGGVHLIRKTLDDLERADRINSIVGSRLTHITGALEHAHSTVSGIDTRATLALAAEGNIGIETVSDEARAAIQNVMSSFGARHGARNLFSGDKIDASPFGGAADQLLADVTNIVQTSGGPAAIEAALDFYFDDPAGGFYTQIYQGSTRSADPVRLASGETVSAGIRGDDPVIRETLRGLAVLASATSAGLAYNSSDFKDLFGQGISASSSGAAGLIDLQSQLGIDRETISKANSRNTFEALTLSQAYQNIVGRDQYEAAAELKGLEVQLESAFLITSRMASLNLVNFLR